MPKLISDSSAAFTCFSVLHAEVGRGGDSLALEKTQGRLAVVSPACIARNGKVGYNPEPQHALYDTRILDWLRCHVPWDRKTGDAYCHAVMAGLLGNF